MKGYKAFEPGLVCRGKHYSENTVFEEDAAEICKSGMHFCENPFDVLDCYPLVNKRGDFSEFATVEADEVETGSGKMFCAKKLKIGAKLSFARFVKVCVDFCIEKTRLASVGASRYEAQISSSEDTAKIGSSRDWVQISASGDWAHIGSSGYEAQISSSGNWACIVSSGDGAHISCSGDRAQIGSSGDTAQISASGYGARIGSSGDGAQISASGDWAQIGSSGDWAQISASGDGARIGSSGRNSVICCAGNNAVAKAKIGSWITLSEWGENGEGKYAPLCVKTEFVDGERIKEDTLYWLRNGEFVEVNE